MPGYGGTGLGGDYGGMQGTSSAGSGYGGSGYGGNQSGQHHGGMSQATKDALAAMAQTDVSNTDAEVAKSRLAEERDRQIFAQRMQEEADPNNPIKYTDTLSLYDTLKAKNINPAQVSIKNFEQGPFAQKNVVMHNQQRIAQFGEVPTFGIAGMLSKFANIDTRGLVLSPSLSEDLDRGGGGDPPSTMELLYPTEGGSLAEEEIAAAEDPNIGYNLTYYDEIQPYTTFAAGGLASLPANFNPMTGINPFRMMMRGGRI